MQLITILLGASALITPALAQTWTLCNPTINATCPNDPGFGIDHTWDFKESKAVKQSFTITNGKLAFGDDGTEFVINKQKESPTIQSKFYIMFGSVSVVMKAASGRGIVSSIVVQSECLDEIDWEFIGGNGTHAQTNYFGKGNTTSFDRDEWHPVSGDVRDTFHNYTVDWKADKMDFYIDSKWVRTLKYGDANGGKNYPQTPSTVRLGVWAGGDKENNNVGTVEWAGGETDFAQAPFTMVVKSTHVKDYGSGKEYEWTDKTGNWQTIKGIPGDSAAAQLIAKGLDAEEETSDEATGTATDSNTIQSGKNADASSTESDSTTTSDAAASSGTADKAEETEKSIAQKWTEMPQTSKVAIYAGGGAGAALLLGAFLFVCIRQRRRGREERDAYNAKVEKEREDAYQDQMELREKGLGGWDKNAYASQGDDALGGWGGTHVANSTPTASSAPKFTAVATHEIPSRSSSPDSHHAAAAPSPWTGGNQGGMIHNAHNAYNGGYSQNTNIPRSPNFPLASQGGGSFNAQGAFPPSGNGGGFGGLQHGGYQRF